MIASTTVVINFIKRRFPENDGWTDGNCYYFATILKARFPQAIIWYDFVKGHFYVTINGIAYDWHGIIIETSDYFSKYCLEWDKVQEYDALEYERIIRDCIY